MFYNIIQILINYNIKNSPDYCRGLFLLI
jgi:hypothetical protein